MLTKALKSPRFFFKLMLIIIKVNYFIKELNWERNIIEASSTNGLKMILVFIIFDLTLYNLILL